MENWKSPNRFKRQSFKNDIGKAFTWNRLHLAKGKYILRDHFDKKIWSINEIRNTKSGHRFGYETLPLMEKPPAEKEHQDLCAIAYPHCQYTYIYKNKSWNKIIQLFNWFLHFVRLPVTSMQLKIGGSDTCRIQRFACVINSKHVGDTKNRRGGIGM